MKGQTVNRTCLTLAALTALSLPAHADDLALSRNAGICMAFKTAAKDDRDAEQARRAAPNRQLADNYGLNWLRRAQLFGTNRKGEIDQIFTREAVTACRNIGIG